MEIVINGPSYKHPTRDVNNQRKVNFFLSPAGPLGVSDPTKFVSLHTPGKKLMVDCGGNEVRSVMNINDVVYAIVDNNVYKLTIDDDAQTATTTLLGTANTSLTGPVKWSKNATQVMIVDGTATGGYILTQATDTIQQITDTDFTGAGSVVFMDSYFLYHTPSTAQIHATNSSNGLVIDALDVTTAEGSPDNLVGLAVSMRELWAFGTETIEIYYDAANATGFPFTRREGAYIDVGCGAAGSILNFDNTLVWLDNRGFIVRANNYTPEVISDPAVSAAIRSYNRVDDAIAFTHVDRGGLFYVISFPTAKKTWAYDAVTQQWHERAFWSYNAEFEHDIVNCHTRYKQFDLVGDRQSGKIYILDKDTYTDGGREIHRIVSTPHYLNETDQIGVDWIALQAETGKAGPTDDEPMIWLRYSNDGGYTFSDKIPRSLGDVGEYGKPITWYRLGTGRQWYVELEVVADQPISLMAAYAGVMMGDPGT